jgi:hypothetical protein
MTAPKTGLLAHHVYFKLKDRSAEAKEKLLAECERYLAPHEGIVFFAVGTIAEELARPVNDRDWDVALHVVFVNLAAHDAYQVSADHLAFVAANKDTWAAVRVFDSVVRTGS